MPHSRGLCWALTRVLFDKRCLLRCAICWFVVCNCMHCCSIVLAVDGASVATVRASCYDASSLVGALDSSSAGEDELFGLKLKRCEKHELCK